MNIEITSIYTLRGHRVHLGYFLEISSAKVIETSANFEVSE
jgi:hypothetical protein